MRIYISGAITGTTDADERFKKAERDLIEQGHTPFNPECVGRAIQQAMSFEMEYEDYMIIDECFVKLCDGIYMLKGYENSNGARHELMLAVKLGKTVMYEEKLP